MKVLIILHDAPYGTERTYNGLRLAHALAKAGAAITLFLLGDAVSAAKRGQRPPDGFYNVETMIGRVLAGSGSVLLCGRCMDARGLAAAEVIEGAQRSDMAALAQAAMASERVVSF